MSRAQTIWYKQYADEHRRAKMLRLKRKGGAEYIGVYRELRDVMLECTDYGFKREHIEDVAFGLHYETELVIAVVNECVSLGLFEEDDRIYCPAIRKQQKPREAAAEASRENGKKGGRPRKDSNQNPNKTYPVGEREPITSTLLSSDLILNKKETTAGGKPEPPPDMARPYTTEISATERAALLMPGYAEGNEDWLNHQIQMASAQLKSDTRTVANFAGYVEKWVLRERAAGRGPETWKPPPGKRKTAVEIVREMEAKKEQDANNNQRNGRISRRNPESVSTVRGRSAENRDVASLTRELSEKFS